MNLVLWTLQKVHLLLPEDSARSLRSGPLFFPPVVLGNASKSECQVSYKLKGTGFFFHIPRFLTHWFNQISSVLTYEFVCLFLNIYLLGAGEESREPSVGLEFTNHEIMA